MFYVIVNGIVCNVAKSERSAREFGRKMWKSNDYSLEVTVATSPLYDHSTWEGLVVNYTAVEVAS
jgi:hypothetical protein